MAIDLKALSETASKAIGQVAEPLGSLTALNETETRALLIDPLLHGLGYVTMEQMRREYRLSASRQVVDYLLRAGERQVVVEAKASASDLSPQDAGQLVGYCAQEGVRWALLTNGLTWQIYDVEVSGNWEAKRVAVIDLLTAYREGRMESELRPLAHFDREELSKGDLPLQQWASRRRTTDQLARLITNPESRVVRAAVEELRGANINVEAADVVSLLRAMSLDDRPDPARAAHVPTSAAPPDLQYPNNAATTLTHCYLFPAASVEDTSSVDQLHLWLSRGFWGVGSSTAHRTRIRAGERCCFYATGIGIVAHGTIAAPADQIVEKREWPGPNAWRAGVYKLLVSDTIWHRSPLEISADLRRTLDAFRDKEPSGPWSWFVQTTSQITEHDFEILTEHA